MADLALDRGVDILARRAQVARFALFAFMILSLFRIFETVGEATGRIDLQASDITAMIGLSIYVPYLLSLIVSIILVAMWIYRAHANLRAVGFEGLSYTPGWAVGWFFVPFANLFKPFDAMRELWNTSVANSAYEGKDAHLGRWWGTWIGGNILNNAGARMETIGNAELSIFGFGVYILSILLMIAAAWFLTKLIQQITAAQQDVMRVAGVFD